MAASVVSDPMKSIIWLESAASLYCKPEVQFESRNHSIEGKTVLEIYIPPVENKPVYARDEENRWMAYMRVADENILASIIQLQVWKEEKKAVGKLLEFTRREEILLGYLEKNPGASLSKIQRDTGFKRKELVSLLPNWYCLMWWRCSSAMGKTAFG